ncbi:hypothetical protein ACJMK2_032932 [Sinanodonta woodiana]|uniref:Sushi domain-containing protein n=1 Tax=Sinanodonta woodiana TaxID=1069815 RepID=A0ABD3X389_SINWO
MAVPQITSFFTSVFLLQTFIFPDFLQAQRSGETGRYMYTDDTNQNRYCHYCDKKDLDYYGLWAQVKKCMVNNVPFNKTDEEEQEKKLRPICNRGKLPSCPLLHRILNGEWICSHNTHLMESRFYNETVDGYILPVYTNCNLVCDKGYHVIGLDSLYCNESRQWDTDTGRIRCAKDPYCPLLNRTLNGEWICSFRHHKVESNFSKETGDGDIYPVGTSCSLVCTDGYHVSGTNMIHCNESHQWDTDTRFIHCAKNSGQNGAIEEPNLPVIIGSVIGVCVVIGIAVILILRCYFHNMASYTTAEEESSDASDKSSLSMNKLKEAEEHDKSKDNEETENEKNSLLKPNPASWNEVEDHPKVRTRDKIGDRKKGRSSIGNKKSNQEEAIVTPVQDNDSCGVHVESKRGDSVQEQINKGLQEDQTEMLLSISYTGDNDDNADNHVERERAFITDSCQVLSKGREPADGIEARDCSHEHEDDTLLKSKNLKKEIRQTVDTNINQLCEKGRRIDSVVKTDTTVDPISDPSKSHPQNILKDSAVKDNGAEIQLLRKGHEKQPTGRRKKDALIAEGGCDPKVKVAYLLEEQGREQLMVQEYEDNKFSVPSGKRFFIIPRCQETISRLNMCKVEGQYRGSQYGTCQFLHMVESAMAEDNGSYRWKIFVDECSLPKYHGSLFIRIISDELGFVSLSPLDSNLLSRPLWLSMNPESLLDDDSLSLRDRPTGTSCSISNQAGSRASTGLHHQETGSATCQGDVAAALYCDRAIPRRQFNSDPCLCTQTVASAWNDNNQKMKELIHCMENEYMPWTQLGSRVLGMKPSFLECLEWHLRGKVHDGPMKYILNQMMHEGKRIGHLVEHFDYVQRYDLVNWIKAFHSCDYCKGFYRS